MSTPYEATGRTRQKQRTREAMVAAARELLAEGVNPTVEQAAERGGVSRTTAYRYFANQRALLAATYPELAQSSLLPEHAPDDPLERLEIVVDGILRQIVDHEPELRAQLRLALDHAGGEALPLRRGRAIAWIEEALSPLRGRLGAAELRRVVLAVRATVGIEALVWLTDVAAASRAEAVAIMRSSARRIVSGALADADAARDDDRQRL